MRPIVLTASGVASSNVAVVDHYRTPFNIGLGAVVTGTVTYTVEHTFDDVLNTSITPTWFSHPALASLSSSADGNYAFPVRAIRVTNAGGSTGATVLTVIQAGMPGI